jgi:cyanophycinase
MSGILLLEGGAEFGGQMAVPDREALAAAGGPDAPIAVIPAAAAPDNNTARAGQRARRWFRHLGASHIDVLPLVDRQSADSPHVVRRLQEARLIYLLGGFPAHLAQSLKNSRSWQALLQAYQSGAVIAGSSAGAMVLCSTYYDPFDSGGATLKPGLDLLRQTCVIPHHENVGPRWVPRLIKALPATLLIGIDEETGALRRSPEDRWQVYGKNRVTLYCNDQTMIFRSGQSFHLPECQK